MSQPQRGHTGFPSVCGQRRRRNTFSAPRSDIRMTLPWLSERAAADKRKCCAIKPRRPKEHTTNMIDVRLLVKLGGDSYIMPDFHLQSSAHARHTSMRGGTRLGI